MATKAAERARYFIAPCCVLKNGKQSYHLLVRKGLRPEDIVPMTCGRNQREIKALFGQYVQMETK